MNRNAKSFIVAAQELFGKSPILTRDGIQQVVEEKGVAYPYWLVTKSEYRYGRGKYKLPSVFEGTFNAPPVPEVEPIALAAQVVQLRQTKLQDDSDSAIPEKFPNYVPFGFFKDLQNIVRSKMFYPVFITGHSGNGKTLMVEQVCAELNRECIRVNISIETDESDLLGGPVLVDGNTPFRDGPVLLAMKRGAILLIDEVDRGSNKLMCLQGILEGKAFYNKKTGEVIKPAPGFNVIATANSKGQGTDEGKYLVQILDSAFLERFPITVEQEYPTATIEKKILAPLFAHADKEFVDNLVQWADVVRQSYKQGATDELISTRRLVHIAKAFDIFKDRMKAITLCLNRFDEETKTAFLDLYSKVDAKVEMTANTDSVLTVVDNDIPF
jgi:MoxR-like ATPase